MLHDRWDTSPRNLNAETVEEKAAVRTEANQIPNRNDGEGYQRRQLATVLLIHSN